MEDYPNNDDMPWLKHRKDITSVSVGYGVHNIGDRAFFDCENITSVTISDSVKSIGHSAFANCSKLGSITLSKNLVEIGKYAFSSCNNLIEIVIPSSVTTIKDYAFSGSAISEIIIPESVSTLSSCIFSGCSDLYEIKCLGSPEFFYGDTFDEITDSTYVYVPEQYFEDYKEKFPSLGYQLVCIETEEHGAAQDTTPTSTGAPINTDTPITGTPGRDILDSGFCGSSVFWTMYSDGELNIAGSGSMDDYTGVNHTPWNSFLDSITTITINNQVEKIGNYAFSNLSQLQTVTIPANIKNVGRYAFVLCSNLTDIYCYSDPGSISSNAFGHIDAGDTIIHVKTRYYEKYKSKFKTLCIIDDLSYVDLLGTPVALSDQIGVNYYLDYSKEIDIADLSVEFKWGKGSYAKTVSGTFIQNSDYNAKCFTSCSVPARCMTDNIKMTVKKGDDVVVSSTFKIAKYANDLTELYPAENVTTSDYIGLQDNQKLHTLLRAMLDYGAESQKYFNYNTDDLANAKKYTKNLVTVGSVSSSTKSAYSNYDATTMGLIAAKNTIANIGDDNIGLAYDGSAVACKSKLSVRIYFTKTEGFDMSNLSASYKGKALTFKENGDSVYLEIDGMSPKAYAPIGSDLFDCGLTININGKDYTYTYLDYVQKCVVTENGFEDTAVALAVYSYFAVNLGV